MSSETTIRPGDASDLEAIRSIAEAAYSLYIERVGKRPAPMDDDYAALLEAGAVHVACDAADQIVGFLVTAVHDDHLELTTVAVAPQQQGTGVGGRLIALAEDLAREHGRADVRLYTNAAMTENLELYPRLGYRETNRRREAGFDRVFFAKHVEPHIADTPHISN